MKPSSVVWIDGVEASLVHLSDERMERRRLSGAPPGTRIDSSLHEHLARELRNSTAIVLVGPGAARRQLTEYLERTTPEVAMAIIDSVEGQSPSDGDLARLASRYFLS